MRIQQTLIRRPGAPRWWCLGLDDTVAPWMHRGKFPAHPTREEAEGVYDEAIKTLALTWADGKVEKRPVIQIVGPEHRLDINNPTRLMEIAASRLEPPMRIRQYPDRVMVYPLSRELKPWEEYGVPWEYALTFSCVAYSRPNGGVHWVLCDRWGYRVLFDPDESLQIDGWKRDGQWRGIQIVERAA